MKFLHSGDIGDVIFFMPVMKILGGVHTVMLADRMNVPPRTRCITKHRDLLARLFESQPYCESLINKDEGFDADMSLFRTYHQRTSTLASAQLTWFTRITGKYLPDETDKTWIDVGDPKKSGKVVISRSARYHNRYFPWAQIVKHYGDRIIYIGLQHEHEAFCREFGYVKHEPIIDYFELAQIIKAGSLFIGNQSSPGAVAIGLGVDMIQEMCEDIPDCVFRRSNIQYVYNGAVTLPDVDGSGEMKLEAELDMRQFHDTNPAFAPPGGWQYPELQTTAIPMWDVISMVARAEKCSKDEAKIKLVEYNVRRCPAYFMEGSTEFDNSITALRFAGLIK